MDAITWPAGEDNTPGIQQNVYFADMNDIETLPQPDKDDSNGPGKFEDLVTISKDIKMKEGKTFHQLYCTLEKGQLTDEVQGDLDAKSYMNQITVYHPGTRAKALGFRQWAKNSNLVIIFFEQDGTKRILGHQAYPAKLESDSGGTGQSIDDAKGSEMVFKSARKGPAPIFTGKVTVPGDVSNLSGVEASGSSGGVQVLYYAD